jgi:hypothetical protein
MQTTGKICVRCQTECSDRPRIKDQAGRYICKPCLKPEELSKLKQGRSAAPAAAGHEAVRQLDESSGALPDVPAIPITVSPSLSVCPKCRSSIPYGQGLCIECGYDVARGRQLSTTTGVEEPPLVGKPAADKCTTCGYSLKGLNTPRCPECGTLSLPSTVARDRLHKQSRDTVRWAYLKPLIQFAVGFAVIILYYAFQNDMSDIAYYAISYIITVPIGVVAFFICCALWMGFDAPLHLTAIRLAGVYAVTDAVGVILGQLPIPLLPWIITLMVYIGLLADSLELDLQDAMLVGIVTWFIKLFAVIAIATQFQ